MWGRGGGPFKERYVTLKVFTGRLRGGNRLRWISLFSSGRNRILATTSEKVREGNSDNNERGIF